MMDDIIAWLVLNFALLYAAYWLWVKTHGSAHQQEQDNIIIKWAQELEAEGKISPLEKRSFVGDLIADSIPGRPEGVSKAISLLIHIWIDILFFRWTIFGLLMMGGLVYGTIENMVKYEDRIAEHNIDDSRMLYRISTPGCRMLLDADANVVQLSTVDSECSLSESQKTSAIAKHNQNSAIKSEPSTIIWTYIFAFVWFYGILNLVDPTDDPNYNSEKVFESFLVGWVIISILLFPITFMEYPSSVEAHVEGTDISVSTVYLTNNQQGYAFTSPTYMGKIRDDFSYNTL